jgi:hypothetical protein
LTEIFNFGFSRSFLGKGCGDRKNDGQTPHQPTYTWTLMSFYEGRMGIWKRLKHLYLVGRKFYSSIEILNLAKDQI